MSADYHIVIPARYRSSRLPGKPLAMIGSATLLEHVYRCAQRAAPASVIVATDDRRIESAAINFGAEVIMTATSHTSGTDRIAEVAGIKGWSDDTIVVNLQGDEALMPEACLKQVAQLLQKRPGTDAASLFWPIGEAAEFADPNAVKVVVDEQSNALYFSRGAIPGQYLEGPQFVSGAANRHIGLYAYRVSTLRRFAESPPGRLEAIEKLEQLRILEWGGSITMSQACAFIPAGVDTPADLERVRERLQSE